MIKAKGPFQSEKNLIFIIQNFSKFIFISLFFKLNVNASELLNNDPQLKKYPYSVQTLTIYPEQLTIGCNQLIERENYLCSLDVHTKYTNYTFIQRHASDRDYAVQMLKFFKLLKSRKEKIIISSISMDYSNDSKEWVAFFDHIYNTKICFEWFSNSCPKGLKVYPHYLPLLSAKKKASKK